MVDRARCRSVSSKVDKVARWEGNMEARVEKKKGPKKKKRVKGQQPKKVNCGTMLVNVRSRAG